MPMNRNLYPKNWEEISLQIRRRSWGRCECPRCYHHEFSRCFEINGLPARSFKGKVVLTVMHLNHDPSDNREENLRAACQRCHNRYDAKHRAENRRKRKALEGIEKGASE